MQLSNKVQPLKNPRTEEPFSETFLANTLAKLVEGGRGSEEGHPFQRELQVFLQGPFCHSATLFLVHPQTYEFIHYLTLPRNEGKKMEKKFRGLIRKGLVAETLNSAGGFSVYSSGRRGNGHDLLLALSVPNESVGLLLLGCQQNPYEWQKGALDLYRLLARHLAYTISHQSLTRQLRHQKTLLRQKITERTVGLEQRQRELKTILDSIQTGILIIDCQNQRILNVNLHALEMFDRPRESLLGEPCSPFCGLEKDRCPLSRPDRQVNLDQVETTLIKPDGSELPILKSVSPLVLGGRTCLLESFIDLSERKQLENQFLQSQKLEAVGRLAGGVAHDFNNLLMAVMGYCDLILSDRRTEGFPYAYVEEIAKTAERAAALTRQLLTLSRRQIPQPAVLDINAVITDLKKMLFRVIGEDILLTTDLEEGPNWVRIDRGQLEQVVLNLTVNARDAMPQGGELRIAVSRCTVNPDPVEGQQDLPPGPYVKLTIEDNGQGIEPTTLRRIFEPFFTTKAAGQGTGLGLSTVLNIVKQSGGHIKVESEVGQGTLVHILLPQIPESPAWTQDSPTPPPLNPRGWETILLIEDEPVLRTSIKESLEVFGYRVLEAADGKEALRLARNFRHPIHLILTDLILPGINGPDTADSISELHPESGMLFMSGYTEEMVSRNGLVKGKTNFLQKPFTPTALATKVRELLDRHRISGGLYPDSALPSGSNLP